MSDRIAVGIGHQRLWRIWLIALVAFFFLFVAQTLGEKYGPQASVPWSWLMSVLLPPVAVMGGQFGHNLKEHRGHETVSGFLLNWSVGLSVIYLLVIGAILFGQPLSDRPLTELAQQFSGLLLFTQAFLGVALGALFASQG